MIRWNMCLAVGAASVLLMGLLSGCGGNSATSSQEEASAQANETQAQIEKTEENSMGKETEFLELDDRVRFLGRVHHDRNLHYFNWGCSGFEFTFTGTKAEARFMASGDLSLNGCPYVAVIVDGKDAEDEMTWIALNNTLKYYTLAEGLPYGEHTIKVLRMTECKNGQSALAGIKITGEGEPAPTQAKEKKIEFIGDSNTCGFGMLAEKADSPFKTGEENPYITYAGNAAKAFDADYNMVSVSGWAVHHSKFEDASTLPSIYNDTDGIHYPGTEWDFNRFQPDLVVTHLGYNDIEYLDAHPNAIAAFEKDYADFFKTIREKNPGAYILVAYGMGTTKYLENIQNAMAQSGLDRLSYVQMKDPVDIKCLHPGPRSHKESGEVLIAEIEKVLGWERAG